MLNDGNRGRIVRITSRGSIIIAIFYEQRWWVPERRKLSRMAQVGPP